MKNKTNKTTGGKSKKVRLKVANKGRILLSLTILITIICLFSLTTLNILYKHNNKPINITKVTPTLESRPIITITPITPTSIPTITPTKAPIKRVVNVIRKAPQKATTSRSGFDLDRTRDLDILSQYNVIEHDIFNVTQYTASLEECGKTDGICADGTKVKEWHTVAMGRKYRFGTKIYIPYFKDYPNNGIFVVHDRGGAIKNNNIDVYVELRKDAYKFGRQNLEVYVIEEKE